MEEEAIKQSVILRPTNPRIIKNLPTGQTQESLSATVSSQA